MFNPELLFSIKTFFFVAKVWLFLLRRSRTRIFRKDTVDSRMTQEGLLSSQPLHGLIAVPAIHGKLPQCVEVTTIPMFFEGVSAPPPRALDILHETGKGTSFLNYCRPTLCWVLSVWEVNSSCLDKLKSYSNTL